MRQCFRTIKKLLFFVKFSSSLCFTTCLFKSKLALLVSPANLMAMIAIHLLVSTDLKCFEINILKLAEQNLFAFV